MVWIPASCRTSSSVGTHRWLGFMACRLRLLEISQKPNQAWSALRAVTVCFVWLCQSVALAIFCCLCLAVTPGKARRWMARPGACWKGGAFKRCWSAAWPRVWHRN